MSGNVLLLISLLWFAITWTLSEVSGAPPAVKSDAADILVEDVWQWQLQQWPLFATSVGVHSYDHRLTNSTLAAFEQRRDDAVRFLRRAEEIDTSNDADDAMSLSILKSSLQAFVDGYEYVMFGALNPVTRLQGLQRDYTSWLPLMKKDTEDDYKTLILRYQALEIAIDEHIDLMKKAIEVGRTNNRYSMDNVLDQFDEVILQDDSDVEKSPFFVPFNRSEIPVTQEIWDQLVEDGKAAIVRISNGYKRMKNFLVDEYLGNARPLEGVSSWPSGSDYYSACLLWHLSVNMTADDIHQTGLREVARIERLMLDVIRGIDDTFTGTIRDFFDSLAGNEEFYGKTHEWLLAEYESQISDVIAPKIPDMFNHIPNYQIEVKPMPQDTSGGSYTPPSEDGSRPGVFNVNLFNPGDKPTFGMMALTLHEASPGHHLQITTTMDQNLPSFRRRRVWGAYNEIPMRMPTYTAYTEGWALYAELLGEQMDVYRNEYELLGRYASEMFRATRLVIDTGLHTKQWTYEMGYEYMRNYTSRPDGLIANEIKRYISWPGQACAYKIGEIHIKELRQSAENQLGDKFDIKDFHSHLLNSGSVPLDILDSVVSDYIRDTLNSSAADTAVVSKSLASSLLMLSIILYIFNY